MNYGGNMPDWHQYNPTQQIGPEISPAVQNANHNPIFGPNISPRRLNGPTYSPEGLNKPQNEANFNPRNFQQSPNTLNGPNVLPDNSPMGPAPQMSGCHGPYGAPSPRNTMIDGTASSLDSRNVPSGSLNEAIGQRNHQLSMNRTTSHLNSSTINGSMGPIGQRNTPPSIQGPIPTSSRQGPGSYIACKLPCCNPETNISYQSWEKFGPYQPNVPYRDPGYPVDNRRFGNEFENREQLGTGAYTIDPRRNFPEYKYAKDSIISRTYTHSSGVIQNYPTIQNYNNFPTDYQKYPAYPIKEYPRESSIPNPQNPAVPKYPEQSVIVQQKYFPKQMQYQNGAIPKSIVPTTMGTNVISRAQNPYFNPQLTRDFPRNYPDNTTLSNRSIQTPNPIHAAYPKYQMYQQKIAMQRFSMENHLRELTRIPGYQSHPKYQESVLRYRELLRLQQTVDYQSTVQDPPKVVNSQNNEEIPPINLQFDQNGVLINTSFVPTGFSNLQSPINLQNSKNVQSAANPEIRPLNLQHPEQFKTQPIIENRVQNQDSSLLPPAEQSHKHEEQYSNEKHQLPVQKYGSENFNIPNTDDGKTSSISQRNSKDFADKPELDVRQFLANWDESEDEDGANTNLPDVVLSNTSSGSVVVEYDDAKTVTGNCEESDNCSEAEDCRVRTNCVMLDATENETKLSSGSTDNQIYQCDLPQSNEISKPTEQGLDISDFEKKPIRTGTVIQQTSTECGNVMTLQMMENLANSRSTTHHENPKSICGETESLNNNEIQDSTDKIKDDVIIKKESPNEEQTTISIEEHIKTYDNHENETKICSNIVERIKTNEDSGSSSDKDSSDNTKNDFDSSDDFSGSDDSNSTDTDSISSFVKSPKTIKGTEIHVDAQELSTIPVPLKSNNCEILEGVNLQKQTSFASEESHNPDDISLPDLPTSECTPISTTLNTPIHSDSEESSDAVIDLTTPANPIEIIQNSPMLSFTHSPIKMEPYEHLDENDLTDKMSHDTLDFDFQTSTNSSDNDYEKFTDVSSHTTEQYNSMQNDEDTFDSNCVEISSEKAAGKNIERSHSSDVETKNDVMDNITDQNRFTFNKAIVVTTNRANTTVNEDHQPCSWVTTREHNHQIPINTEHQDAKTGGDIDKLENVSEIKDRSSIITEVTETNMKDDFVRISNAENNDNINEWRNKCEMESVEFETTDNMTALNLVKDENKIISDSVKITEEITNSEVVTKSISTFPSNSNEEEDFKHINQNVCSSLIANEVIFTETEPSVGYVSSSEEDKIYTESIENERNFNGSLNIPLIPGEDFEEPKMPVLPMEGNCLTKIIKNTSPITDLDVLGSDDEKLDKMDEIWMEVGGVDVVGKVTDANAVDTYTESIDASDREKISCSRKNHRMFQKNEWKYLKNSVKPKDLSKLIDKGYNDGDNEKDSNNTTEKDVQLHKLSGSLETAEKELKLSKDLQSAIISETDNTAAISLEKNNSTKVPNISRVTRDSIFCDDGKQSRNNSIETMKCKEKTNHINDIATKLLENARLFEPELRNIQVHNKEPSCSDNSRDCGKKRMKLLKEFRKVKNKINQEKPAIESEKSVDEVSSTKITEEYKKMDEERIETGDETMKEQNDCEDTVKNNLQKSDNPIMNSIDTPDNQVIPGMSMNRDEKNLHAISTDVKMPSENITHTSYDGEAGLNNDAALPESCSNVNTKDNITVEESNNVNDDKSSEIKPMSPIEKDINECAINLTKSSNDFDLLNTLSEKGCVTNDSHNTYALDHMKIEEPVELEYKTHTETSCAETKDDSPILSSDLKNSELCTENIKEDNKILELNNVVGEDMTEDNHESISTPICKNSVDEDILIENTKREVVEKSSITAHSEDPKEFSDAPEILEVSDESCKPSDKNLHTISEDCKRSTDIEINDIEMNPIISKQSEHSKSIKLVVIDEKENLEPVNKSLESEVTQDTGNLCDYFGSESTRSNEESTELSNSFYDSEHKSLLSKITEEKKISIDSSEDTLQNIKHISEEKMTKSVENLIERKLETQEENSIGKLLVAQKSTEAETKISDDYSIKIQKTPETLDVTTNIHADLNISYNSFEILEKTTIINETLTEMELIEGAETECLQRSSVKQIVETNKSLSTVDATFEAFGLENSFNDFDHFDVAPNVDDNADTDQSNDWKYSKAYARFEDCERFKNPDNFVDPLLSSLETLDNLNTVPVYTTKDGRITYSPNPKFTYRTLIMEAREREGYPAPRDSYNGNRRSQESLQHSKNHVSIRKRKNSDTYNSYSGSCGKKNYFEHYEPRVHGESSMNNLSKPWSRTSSRHNKYNYESRDRNSHYSTSHNSDAEKRYTTEQQITQEHVPGRYKYREESTVLDDRNKRKNGTSDSFRINSKKPYKQSTAQSNSAWSESKRNLKYDQNYSDVALLRTEKSTPIDNKKNTILERTISIEKHVNILDIDIHLTDFQQIEKLTSVPDESKYIPKLNTNILPSNAEPSIPNEIPSVEIQFPKSRIEDLESSSPRTDNKPLDNQNMPEMLNYTGNEDSIIKPRELFSEWEDSLENSIVNKSPSCTMKIQTESLLDETEKVCNNEIKVDELYSDVDDICENQETNLNEKKSNDVDPSYNEFELSSNSVESPTRNKIFDVSDCYETKLNNAKKELDINNARIDDTSYSLPVQVITTEKYSVQHEKLEIPEIPNTNESTADPNKGAENIREEHKFNQPLCHRESQIFSSCEENSSTKNCTSELIETNHEDLEKNEIHIDEKKEFTSLKQNSELRNNLIALTSNSQIWENSTDSRSVQEPKEIERREPKIKSSKVKSDNKNKSARNLHQATNNSPSRKTISEIESTSKPQTLFENYIAYSPLSESPEDTKAIPKLVIKKTDSLNVKSICLNSSSTAVHDAFVDKVLDKEDGSKVSMHPKIPKILIRNAKSRPSTPSIEEIIEEKIFSITTKEESKVPKVKIRFEEKIPKSPIVLPNDTVSKTDTTENKIPKMKIKLEDRLSKVIIEKVNAEPCSSNEEVQKAIPKMKIKKFKGELRQIVNTKVLPVSIPRMFIYTELETEKETTPQVVDKSEINTPDNNLKSYISDSSHGNQKTMEDADLKKIPKLKIKRQSSGSSKELNRKRHSVNPIQIELKKIRKPSKLGETNDKRQINKLSHSSEHHDSLKKHDTSSVRESHDFTSSESAGYPSTPQSVESVTNEHTSSIEENINSIPPEEIPKVIIKRASPSAEFKCELSKVKRDAIIKNKKWQPEVKLHRSWVLDCMAKDLNLDKLRLKLATPSSILKKGLAQKESELEEINLKNENENINQNKKKLFRSKSTSELVPTHESLGILTKDYKQLNETNTSNSLNEMIVPKRSKSDLGRRFSKYSENPECKKKLSRDNHLSTIRPACESTLNYANNLTQSSSIQSMEKANMVIEKNQEIEDTKTNFNFNETQSNNEIVHFMQLSKISKDKTLDENEISTPTTDSLLLNYETSERSLPDLDLKSKKIYESANTTYNSGSICERSKNSDEDTHFFNNESKADETNEASDNSSHYSTNKCKNSIEVTKDLVIVKNTDIDSIERSTNAEEKHLNEIRNKDTKTTESLDSKNNYTTTSENLSINYIDEVHNLRSSIERNDIQTLDLDDKSDENIRKANDINAVSKQLIYDNTVKQENAATLNGKVLITSVINENECISADAKNIQNPKIDFNLNDSSDNAIDANGNSVKKITASVDSQSIIDILSGSPSHGMEIQLCPDVSEETDMCLYHEDAIPTQFELELELIDNGVPDPLEVPMPQNDHSHEEYPIYPAEEANEVSYQENIILNKSEDSMKPTYSNSKTIVSEKNISQSCSTSTYQRKVSAHPDKQERTTLSVDIDARKSTNNACMKLTTGLDSNVQKSSSSSDSLVKEVLAAKERLRKYLGRNKNENLLTCKSRPKTAAEKKQGSSFDLNILPTSEDSLPKLGNHYSNYYTAGSNSSSQMERNFSSGNSNDKPIQNQTKTEHKVNKIKSEKKHSKSNKSIVKKYSTVATSIQKYANLMRVEEYAIPKHSSIDIKDRIEFSKGETTISLKNSKYLIKNHSYSTDEQKKMPELINSKDTKCRTKSSKYEVNSKYVGKSKNALANAMVQESSVDICQAEAKSVSDATKPKYKSLKSSLDQNVNSMTDKAKFKLYKIPKISKPTHPESGKFIGELHESQSTEARMPILEPQVDLNGDLELSELASDRETSRSPPVITNQECQVSFNQEKELLSRQRTMFFEKQSPEAMSSYSKETTVADIVNDMAYHEKATIRHKRYCTLCERWFPTVTRYRRHLSGYQHRHTELTQRRTIHALFTLFTGRPCPRLQPPGVVRIDCEPGEMTPLQIAVQGVTKESNKVYGNIDKPTKEDK